MTEITRRDVLKVGATAAFVPLAVLSAHRGECSPPPPPDDESSLAEELAVLWPRVRDRRCGQELWDAVHRPIRARRTTFGIAAHDVQDARGEADFRRLLGLHGIRCETIKAPEMTHDDRRFGVLAVRSVVVLDAPHIAAEQFGRGAARNIYALKEQALGQGAVAMSVPQLCWRVGKPFEHFAYASILVRDA